MKNSHSHVESSRVSLLSSKNSFQGTTKNKNFLICPTPYMRLYCYLQLNATAASNYKNENIIAMISKRKTPIKKNDES